MSGTSPHPVECADGGGITFGRTFVPWASERSLFTSSQSSGVGLEWLGKGDRPGVSP